MHPDAHHPTRALRLPRPARHHLFEEPDLDDLWLACAECGCSECSVYWDVEDQRAPDVAGPHRRTRARQGRR
ncbi:MAG TPA: hypothetical protein ENI87_12930 [bacterium]|nr:hypothetical protein [bacterium]